MNLKRYEEAADQLSQAIQHAPDSKQPGLRDLRKQCLLAESGVAPAAPAAVPNAHRRNLAGRGCLVEVHRKEHKSR